jgi:hypothetical protein
MSFCVSRSLQISPQKLLMSEATFTLSFVRRLKNEMEVQDRLIPAPNITNANETVGNALRRKAAR